MYFNVIFQFNVKDFGYFICGTCATFLTHIKRFQETVQSYYYCRNVRTHIYLLCDVLKALKPAIAQVENNSKNRFLINQN